MYNKNNVTHVKSGTYRMYYRFMLNGKIKRIFIGDQDDNKTRIAFRYERAKNVHFNYKYGMQSVPNQVQPVIQEKSKSLLFKDVLPGFINAYSGKTKTWLRDLHNLKHFVGYFGEMSHWSHNQVSDECKIDLSKIKATHIDEFYQDQYAKGFKTNTVNCRHKYLSQLYSWLVRTEKTKKNIYLNKSPLKAQGSDSKQYQVLHRDHISKIIGLAKDPDHKKLWTIMAWTGLAPIDAINLRKSRDVVNNGKFTCIITSRQKTKVIAQVPVLGDLAKLGDTAFDLDMTKKDMTNANLEFRRLAVQVGIVEKEGFIVSQYCLRHSLATFLRTHLTDNEIALLLGQKNIKQQNTYTSPESAELAEKLSRVLN